MVLQRSWGMLRFYSLEVLWVIFDLFLVWIWIFKFILLEHSFLSLFVDIHKSLKLVHHHWIHLETCLRWLVVIDRWQSETTVWFFISPSWGISTLAKIFLWLDVSLHQRFRVTVFILLLISEGFVFIHCFLCTQIFISVDVCLLPALLVVFMVPTLRIL